MSESVIIKDPEITAATLFFVGLASRFRHCLIIWKAGRRWMNF